MHRILTTFLSLVVWSVGHAPIIQTKVIDGGGSGPYAAVAVTEETLPDFVVYRPRNLDRAVEAEGKLPAVIWANGGYMNSSIHYERLLSEIASHGYVVVAIGALQLVEGERESKHTPEDELLRGLDWITERAVAEGSDYFGTVNPDQLALAGQSCGGAQVMRIAGNPRVTTYMMFNSGRGDMTRAGASTTPLEAIHGPALYVEGVESDLANHETAGHGGTFAEANGGSLARLDHASQAL